MENNELLYWPSYDHVDSLMRNLLLKVCELENVYSRFINERYHLELVALMKHYGSDREEILERIRAIEVNFCKLVEGYFKVLNERIEARKQDESKADGKA